MPGQFGLEPTSTEWVNGCGACTEVARVLKPTGALWLDLGDSYSRHPRYGAPAKGSLLAPERLLLALAADGWIVRNKVIWAKPNPMPTSVTDRLNTTYDVVYFLVRSPRYFFDLDAIREPHRSSGRRSARPAADRSPGWAGPLAGKNDGLLRARARGVPGHELGKNPGDVWRIATPRLPRRPLRHLPRGAGTTSAARHLSGSGLHRLLQAVDATISVEHVGTVTPTAGSRLVRHYPRGGRPSARSATSCPATAGARGRV